MMPEKEQKKTGNGRIIKGGLSEPRDSIISTQGEKEVRESEGEATHSRKFKKYLPAVKKRVPLSRGGKRIPDKRDGV